MPELVQETQLFPTYIYYNYPKETGGEVVLWAVLYGDCWGLWRDALEVFFQEASEKFCEEVTVTVINDEQVY